MVNRHEFELYLDAVNKSVERTRLAFYLLILSIVVVYAAWHNTDTTTWLKSRISVARVVVNCYSSNSSTTVCNDRVRAYKTAGINNLEDAKAYLNELIKEQADINSIQVPLLTNGASSGLLTG